VLVVARAAQLVVKPRHQRGRLEVDVLLVGEGFTGAAVAGDPPEQVEVGGQVRERELAGGVIVEVAPLEVLEVAHDD
jgi:hypothetical protein